MSSPRIHGRPVRASIDPTPEMSAMARRMAFDDLYPTHKALERRQKAIEAITGNEEASLPPYLLSPLKSFTLGPVVVTYQRVRAIGFDGIKINFHWFKRPVLSIGIPSKKSVNPNNSSIEKTVGKFENPANADLTHFYENIIKPNASRYERIAFNLCLGMWKRRLLILSLDETGKVYFTPYNQFLQKIIPVITFN